MLEKIAALKDMSKSGKYEEAIKAEIISRMN